MKISVSLPDDDIAYLDAQGGNRSAALHRAVVLMRRRDLGDQYAEAYEEFASGGEQQVWDGATADGLDR